MTTTMNINDCIDYLKAHDGYLIVTHIRPDGDTLGCAAALCHTLRRMGKTAYILKNPELMRSYEAWIAPFHAPEDFAAETVVAVDMAAESVFPIGFDRHVDLCIDHHATNSGYADHVCCEPEDAACGELVLKLVKGLVGGLDRETADYLYIAVSTDTGCFVYANTTADTHRAAAELIEAGADMKSLNVKLFRTFSYSRVLLESMIYGGLRRYHNGEINVATVTLDMMEKAGATEDDCDDLASLAGRVEGNRVSCTIRQMGPGECKISLRSGEFFDSAAVCALHGGGGHRMAAGCTVLETPERAREILVREIEEAMG